MHTLVLGGTLFFGRRLVNTLLAAGHTVTVVTRGNRREPFDQAVDWRLADRTDADALAAALGDDRWDVAFDQIGYSPDDAELLRRLLDGRVEHLVFMSTGAVYTPTGRPLVESEFDPTTHPVRRGDRTAFDYGEGKRLAEAVYFQRAQFSVTAARFPIVIGPDDYTTRLARLIDRVRQGEPLHPLHADAHISLLTSADAARLLAWAGENRIEGAVNGQTGAVAFRELLDWIAADTGGSIDLGAPAPSAAESKSFQIDQSSWLDRTRAETLGCPFADDLRTAVREAALEGSG